MSRIITFLAILIVCATTILLKSTRSFIKEDAALAKSVDVRLKVPTEKLEQLGKEIFFDKNLSNPPGLACASCHNPQAGYVGSVSSQVNAEFGVMPGAVSGRFLNRKPLTLTYAKFCPEGPPFYDQVLKSYFGGFFLDGRASNFIDQFHVPLLHPNEMNNILHNQAAPQVVVEKIRTGTYAKLVQQTYGPNIFTQSPDKIIRQLAKAVAAFESSSEISPFSSKYDAYLAGKVELTPAEFEGLKLVTGSSTGRPGGPPSSKDAQCVLCHGIPLDAKDGPDLWTIYSYENIGVPKNPKNPYYAQTDKKANPLGYNSLGAAYVDIGLGDYIYPAQKLPAGNIGAGNNGKGDFLAVNGKFKIATLRNIDKRPNENFVKAYMHNGYFKSLKDVVHFYNTRNLTTSSGETIDFTSPSPYANLQGKPIWPAPEYPSPITLQNPDGLPGQIGHLQLTDKEENDIVAFLKTLSDGYFQN